MSYWCGKFGDYHHFKRSGPETLLCTYCGEMAPDSYLDVLQVPACSAGCQAHTCNACGGEIEGVPWRIGRHMVYVYMDEAGGTCGSLIRYEGARQRGATPKDWRARVFCSEPCVEDYRRGQWREYRERNRRDNAKDCAECGERFHPRRADASTCSPACRQRAYRKRHKEVAV